MRPTTNCDIKHPAHRFHLHLPLFCLFIQRAMSSAQQNVKLSKTARARCSTSYRNSVAQGLPHQTSSVPVVFEANVFDCDRLACSGK